MKSTVHRSHASSTTHHAHAAPAFLRTTDYRPQTSSSPEPKACSLKPSSSIPHSAFRTPHSTGAALIIALAVMAILLFIGLSFYTVTRLERKTAANTANTIRAELLADGGLAIATAFLQHDWAVHPTATSIDHAWRTYFNGSWAAAR